MKLYLIPTLFCCPGGALHPSPLLSLQRQRSIMTAPGIANDSFVHRTVAGAPEPIDEKTFSREHARRISTN
jgi:hypothetical protein